MIFQFCLSLTDAISQRGFLCQTKGVHNQARARLNAMFFVFVFQIVAIFQIDKWVEKRTGDQQMIPQV